MERYFPQEIQGMVGNHDYVRNEIGMSASEVLIFPEHVLKIQEQSPETDNEKVIVDWLEQNQPAEELVFSHGDFCLPNIFAEGGEISGFIDLGRMGPADRWQDVALCLRSLKDNLNGQYSGGMDYAAFEPQMLLDELGMEMDEEKMRYYVLLDELF